MKYRVSVYYTTPSLRDATKKFQKTRPDWQPLGKEVVACTSYDVEVPGILTQDDERKTKDMVVSEHFREKEKQAHIIEVKIELLPPV